MNIELEVVLLALLIFYLDRTLAEITGLSIPIIKDEIKRYPYIEMPGPKDWAPEEKVLGNANF